MTLTQNARIHCPPCDPLMRGTLHRRSDLESMRPIYRAAAEWLGRRAAAMAARRSFQDPDLTAKKEIAA